MSSKSFFAPFKQAVYQDIGISGDGRIVGSLSEERRYVDANSPDFLQRVLSSFIKVKSEQDALVFCRDFGFPLSPYRDDEWLGGWFDYVPTKAIVDLAASYRLLFELIKGLLEDEALLFENLLALETPADLEDSLLDFFADYASLKKSRLDDGRALASRMSNGLLPSKRVILLFYPRNYFSRWSGRIMGRFAGIVPKDSDQDHWHSQFGYYEIPSNTDTPITPVRRAASLVVKSVLNLMLQGIHPCTEYESNQLKTYFRLPSIQHGMAWVLYSNLTGAISLERCPHPSCGALYSKRGKQGCCGLERCQKWVSRQKKKKKIGGVS